MMQTIARAATVMMLFAGTTLWAQTDTKVESGRAVASADGQKTVVIDRFTPMVNGEPERFSGRMLVRVTSADGSPTRQRYIEASQVRVIQPPVWIDGNRVCAFVYNVAKNSNGIVYFEPETNRALQVEFVMPARQMAASGKVEQELTSLEVSEFTSQGVLKTRNVPWKGGSAFPLVLPPLPSFDGRPYDTAFLKQLNDALAAYKGFLKRNNITSLEPEQASESFSEDELWLGLLACSGGDSYLLGIPLAPGAAENVLSKTRAIKTAGLSLACSQQVAGDGGEAAMTDSRFLTAWKNGTTLQAMKETYGAESDEPVLSPVFALDVKTGAVQEQATSGTLTAAETAVPAVQAE